MEVPLSSRPALSPLECCVALMPKTGGEYVPKPYRVLLEGKASELQALLNGAESNALSPEDISQVHS